MIVGRSKAYLGSYWASGRRAYLECVNVAVAYWPERTSVGTAPIQLQPPDWEFPWAATKLVMRFGLTTRGSGHYELDSPSLAIRVAVDMFPLGLSAARPGPGPGPAGFSGSAFG